MPNVYITRSSSYQNCQEFGLNESNKIPVISVKQSCSRAAHVGQFLRWKGEHIYYTTVLLPVLWNTECGRQSVQKWPSLLFLSESCHFLCSGRPSAYKALGNYVLMLPSSAWMELILPLWFSLWVQQVHLCYRMCAVHGSSYHCALCQTKQHHSFCTLWSPQAIQNLT